LALELDEDRPPTPPADLILRVVGSFGADDMQQTRRSFDLDGLRHLEAFERALAGAGHSLTDFDRLLDFGCGCGRFLRHFRALSEQVEIHGTDIDAEMIEWLRRNLPYAHVEVAAGEPPLPYPDKHFDLIINHSVFTHLDEHHQDLWLAELQRITAPGGLLLLTVEGQTSWNRTCAASERAGDNTERWRSELETRGILFISDDQFIGSTHPDFYHATVHAPWYVFEHWTRFFDLVTYTVDGSLTQDLIVLRRRADGSPQPRPIGRRPVLEPVPAAAPAPAPAPAVRSRALANLARLARLAGGLRGSATPPAASASGSPGVDGDAIRRELNMLRAGMYEQGRRISVIAAQLRDELESSRGEDPH
jgi:SAM-dependent methyltransferase